jgi:quercetin dioxygenase-like cupin family protein
MKQGHVDSLNRTTARPGVVRRVFSGEGATLAFTTMDPGHEAMPHSHPHEQIEYLLAGRMRFVVGDEETIVEQGGLLVVPPGVEHFGETLGDEPVVALSVFSPKRDEYAAEEA